MADENNVNSEVNPEEAKKASERLKQIANGAKMSIKTMIDTTGIKSSFEALQKKFGKKKITTELAVDTKEAEKKVDDASKSANENSKKNPGDNDNPGNTTDDKKKNEDADSNKDEKKSGDSKEDKKEDTKDDKKDDKKEGFLAKAGKVKGAYDTIKPFLPAKKVTVAAAPPSVVINNGPVEQQAGGVMSKLGALAKGGLSLFTKGVALAGKELGGMALDGIKLASEAQSQFRDANITLADQLTSAKDGMDGLKTSIGTALLPVAQQSMTVINGAVGQLNDAFSAGGLQGVAGAVGGVVAGALNQFAQMAPAILTMLSGVIQALISGIQGSLPQIVSNGMSILSSLLTTVMAMLPQLLELGIQIIAQLAMGIGTQLPTLIPLAIQCILQLITVLLENLPLIIEAGIQLLSGLIQGIVNAIPLLMEMLPTIIQTILTVLTENLPLIIQSGIGLLFSLMMGILQAIPMLIDMLPTIITTMVTILNENLPQIIQGGMQLLLALINGLVQALPQLIDMLPMIIGSILDVILTNLPQLIDAGIKILVAIIEGLAQAIPKLIDSLPQIMSAIIDAFEKVDWIQTGKNILDGIGSGIMGAVGDLIRNTLDAVGRLKDSIFEFFGIHSPSRLMRDMVGKNIVLGIGVGFENEMPNLQKDIDGNMSDMVARMRGAVDCKIAATTTNVASNNSAITKDNAINDTLISGSGKVIENHIHVDIEGREVAKAVAPYQGVFDTYQIGR